MQSRALYGIAAFLISFLILSLFDRFPRAVILSTFSFFFCFSNCVFDRVLVPGALAQVNYGIMIRLATPKIGLAPHCSHNTLRCAKLYLRRRAWHLIFSNSKCVDIAFPFFHGINRKRKEMERDSRATDESSKACRIVVTRIFLSTCPRFLQDGSLYLYFTSSITERATPSSFLAKRLFMGLDFDLLSLKGNKKTRKSNVPFQHPLPQSCRCCVCLVILFDIDSVSSISLCRRQ